jgi:nucleosome-remodeling factor subunit BPTF
MTSIEREEKEKVKKKEKKQEEEETMQQATWVKYTFPVKHQVTLPIIFLNHVSHF